jgi:hypothetical protein
VVLCGKNQCIKLSRPHSILNWILILRFHRIDDKEKEISRQRWYDMIFFSKEIVLIGPILVWKDSYTELWRRTYNFLVIGRDVF